MFLMSELQHIFLTDKNDGQREESKTQTGTQVWEFLSNNLGRNVRKQCIAYEGLKQCDIMRHTLVSMQFNKNLYLIVIVNNCNSNPFESFKKIEI